MARSLFACVLPLLVTLQACAPRTAARIPAAAAVADPVARLRADLSDIFDDPSFVPAQWGVEIVSLDRAETLYARNAHKLYMPASNNKILTAAAALVRLGPSFRYRTGVLAEGTVSGGVLHGRLWIIGAGDPSIAPRFADGDAFRTFRGWAETLKKEGVARIEGGLVADDRGFEENLLGSGWEWDDLAYGYAAPVSALQFNENLATLEIAPAAGAGGTPAIRQSPLADYFTIENRLTTAAPGTEAHVDIVRDGPGERLRVTGSVPGGGPAVSRSVAVGDPSSYALRALRQALTASGIECSPCELRVAPRSEPPPPLTPLWVHESPTLAEIIRPLLKVSQNLYAETLVRTLGLVLRGEGSFARGKEVVEEALAAMAVEPGAYFYADGSGLSRHNLVSVDSIVRILTYVHRHRHSGAFHEALPVAGVDGTIAGRMKGTRGENNVHAKTGTIAYVRSLSGYVRTADDELLAFSMIANNFLSSSRSAEFLQDRALERLASFTRRPPVSGR